MTDAGAPPGPADDVSGLVRDGQAKFASGEVEQARNAFAKALKLKPDDAGAKAGLERCERLLAERDKPPPEAESDPSWSGDVARNDDFPDSGENPEATIVDPNYLAGLGVPRGPDAGASGEFPEPLTMPRTPAIEQAGEKARSESPAAGPEQHGPPRPGEPAYPRYVATMPGNYPEVRPGGRPAASSPPPIAPGTPLPGPGPAPMMAVAYPQMPPGGPSAYPQFATPVGGYAPGPAAGPGAYAVPDQRRWTIICASVGAGCLLLGLLLGWAIFGASDEAEPEAGSVVPLVAIDAGGGSRAKAPAGSADATPAAPSAASAAAGAASGRVSAIERPVLVAVTAPSAGQVVKLHARAAAHVKAGARLYSLKGDKKAQAETVVQSPRAGRFEVRAAEGDQVAEGDLLGLVVDPDAWLLVADLTGEAVATSWRCEASSSDGISRSPCRIDSVERLGGGRSRAAARISARDAGWLKGDEKDLIVTVTPP